ncbi:MAG: Hsp20/alpha crystallin family protein [Terriglobales bacterium]
MPSRAIARREYAPDLFDLRRNFDDFFSRFSSSWEPSSANLDWIPAADSYMDQNKFHVRMALPGVRPDEVNLQVHGNELRISGDRKQEVTPPEDRTFQREIVYGSFERVFTLPEGIQPDKVEANFHNGVLDITAPLSEKALPRRIQISSADAPSGRKLAA